MTTEKKEPNKFVSVNKKLDINWKRNKVVEMAYNGDFTKEEIKDHVQQISNEYKKKGFNGMIEVALPYDQGWRAGYFTQVGEPISMYDFTDSGDTYNEQNTFSGFRIYVMRTPTATGGCSTDNSHNDCLYECLQAGLQSSNRFTSPEHLKKYLKLNRDDMVPVSMMPIIENKLKININVYGDAIYTKQENAQLDTSH